MTYSTRVYLIRHGQVVNHHEMRYNGHSDVDITEAGVAQMQRLSEFLSAGGRRIEAVYSSDLLRAARGARAWPCRPMRVFRSPIVIIPRNLFL